MRAKRDRGEQGEADDKAHKAVHLDGDPFHKSWRSMEACCLLFGWAAIEKFRHDSEREKNCMDCAACCPDCGDSLETRQQSANRCFSCKLKDCRRISVLLRSDADAGLFIHGWPNLKLRHF